MLPVQQFLSYVNEHQLFNPTDKILLAVSGGRDSVLLAHLFNAAGITFGIAHCNFALRGEESDGDENLVRQLAANFNVPFHHTRFDTAQYAQDAKISIQMAARELRYRWFEEIREQSHYAYVALAHHSSDVTETILLNLTRGTGIAGMHGILPKRGQIIRPLLFLTRDEIDHLVDEHQLSFREDSSNLSSKYARNKIRLEVIPKLEEINPSLDNTFVKNAQRFALIEAFLNNEVEQLRQRLFQHIEPACTVRVPINSLLECHPLPLLLFELLEPFGFTEAIVYDIIKCLRGEAGKVFSSSTHQLAIERAYVVIKPNEHFLLSREEPKFWNETEISCFWARYYFTKGLLPIAGFQFDNNPNHIFLDGSLLHFPLQLRLWQKGDFFFPLGMNGRKKISDFLREQKLSLSDKAKVPVLVNGNGDILWVVGYRSDNRYRVHAKTKKVITFEITDTYGNETCF